MKLRTLLAGLLLLPLVPISSAVAAGTVTVKGSDTMVILGQRWAEEYMKKHPDTVIQVTGGGSGTGISALINGTTDICQSSRSMKPAEKEKLRDRYNNPGVEIPDGARRPRRLRQRAEPADRADDGPAQGHLHRQDHELEGRRRPRREDHPVLAREQLGHLRVLQGARAGGRRLHAARADDAGNGGGRERGGQGEVRHRLRRRGLRQGDQDPQGEEGRGQPFHRCPTRRR